MRRSGVVILLGTLFRASCSVVSALSNPSSSLLNSSSPIHLPPIIKPNLTAPAPPPGFTADVTLDRTKPLDDLEVYNSTIYKVAEFWGNAQLWWRSFKGRIDWSLEGTHIDLMMRNTETRRSRQHLDVGHVILGLYEAVNTMATEGAFCEANVIISLYRERIGKISFTRRRLAANATTLYNSTSQALKYVTVDGIATNASITTKAKQIGAESEFTDPVNPQLQIRYEFQGPSIPRNDVLSMILDAMLTISYHAVEPFQSLEATSTPESNCILLMSKVPESQESVGYAPKLGRVLLLIMEYIMLGQNRWGDVTFEVVWKGNPIVNGAFASLNRVPAISST